MNKSDAIQLLGGTPASAAKAIGITLQALGQWPDKLSPRLKDRVQAALWRKQIIQRRDLRPNDWHLIWPELAEEVLDDKEKAPNANHRNH